MTHAIQTLLSNHALWLVYPEQGARANLDGANLARANLALANLRVTCLDGANLARANLARANLARANLARANLKGANLDGADLTGTCLSGTCLALANLKGTDLDGADLTGACLRGTCLDPDAPPPPITDSEILDAGLEIDGQWILGWRTARSRYIGSTDYTAPGEYVAPVLSIDATECHPGIYFASRAWLAQTYPDAPVVRCRAPRTKTVHAGDKWRARRIEVLGGEGQS